MAQIYKIASIGQGFLAIMPRPGLSEDLAQSIQDIKQAGTTDVVSLLEPQEAHGMGLGNEAEVCEQNGLGFHSFAIKDHSVPHDVSAVAELSQWAHQKISEGAGIVFHCFGGIGRSGLLAASVLLQEGLSTSEAFAKISSARGVHIPETSEQLLWVESNAKKLVQRQNEQS